MGLISSANLDVANTTVTTAVNDIFKPDAPDTWKQFCQPVPAAGTSIEIVAVDGLPRVRERVAGEALQHGNLRAYKKNLTYRQWEGTFDLPRILVDNDQSGAVGKRVAEWPSVISTYTEDIVTTALLANSVTGYDGQALLSNSHPNVNGTTADNLETAALTWAIMRTVTDSMSQLRTETGLPINVRPSALMVGSANMRLAREMAGPMRPVAIGDSSAIDASTGRAALGFNNYDGQDLLVIENPYIAGIEYLFFDLTKGALKPYLLAEFTKFRVLSQTTEASDGVYERDTYSWSIQGDVSPCPMAWQLAHGSVTAS